VKWSEVFQQIADRKMIKFIPLIMSSGVGIAANAGILVPLIIMTMKNTNKSLDWSD